MVPMHTKLVEKARLDSVLAFEDNESVGDLSAWKCFAEDVEDQKQATIRLLSQLKADGKVVVGYGASTKGNTILQTYGLTPDLLPAIAERSEPKFGLFTVGTGIPIISEQQMRQMRPHYLLVFPYTFIDVFMEREKDLLAQGTKLIAPLPALNIYG
jgi:NDP-4-keto-2,6-dideoxyhexose 3-C-methyltransferase